MGSDNEVVVEEMLGDSRRKYVKFEKTSALFDWVEVDGSGL